MKKVIIPILLLSVLVLPCCQQEKKLPENYETEVCDELSQSYENFIEAWQNEDLETLMSYLDKDFLNMFSYDLDGYNIEKCREGFREVFDDYSIEDVRYERTDCFADHNYAFDIVWFEQKWISNDKQDTIPFKMRIMTVYKKQPDGSWKIFRHMGQK